MAVLLIKEKKVKFSVKIIFLLFSILTATIFNFFIFSSALDSYLLEMLQFEVERLQQQVVNKVFIEFTRESDVIITNVDSDNKVMSLDFDLVKAGRMVADLLSRTLIYFDQIETGDKTGFSFMPGFECRFENGIITYIPALAVTRSPLLVGLGPRIPIKLNLAGQVNTTMRSEIVNAGINTVQVSIIINLTLTSQMFLPLRTGAFENSSDVVIDTKTIQGEVPLYYQGQYNVENGGFSIPLK